MINLQFLKYTAKHNEIGDFRSFFALLLLPFYPHNSPKNENFKKMKRAPRDNITSHMCTKNHMLVILFLRYGAWQMYLLFFILGYFLAFYPLTCSKKQKFQKNWKRHLEISSFCTSPPKLMVICYTVSEI